MRNIHNHFNSKLPLHAWFVILNDIHLEKKVGNTAKNHVFFHKLSQETLIQVSCEVSVQEYVTIPVEFLCYWFRGVKKDNSRLDSDLQALD